MLAVDLDPQGNLSDYFDIAPEAEPTIGDVLAGRATAAEAIHDDVIPANLSARRGRADARRQDGPRADAAQGARRASTTTTTSILIDCPPALGLLTVNALVAADHALLSARRSTSRCRASSRRSRSSSSRATASTPTSTWLGVLLNIADMRTVHSREAFESLKEHVGDKLLEHAVRQSIAYAESAERAISILDHRPDLGADYLRVAEELLRAASALGDAGASASSGWSDVASQR